MSSARALALCAVTAWLLGRSVALAQPSDRPSSSPSLDLGSRLELFVDDFLIDRLKGTVLKLHEPMPAGVALKFDKPWEGKFAGYITVLADHDRLRMYYRGLPETSPQRSTNEVTCYAESRDGLVWTKPNLRLFEVHGTLDNNVVLAGSGPYSHNFAPFLDTNPNAPAAERFKALAGSGGTGLVAFASSDGLRWKKLRETPVFTQQGAFDSQNVAFWSEAEHRYLAYLRTWTGVVIKGYRTISRATSDNFLDWYEPIEMEFGDTPPEHLYTSQTHPYFRAPHIYIAMPMRFVTGRKVLTDEQAAALDVARGYANDSTDTVFMSSRGGSHFTRTFLEAFIRPGPDPGNWAARAGLTALGVVPTGPAEMSFYKQAHYAQPSAHLIRYTLRTDGFISVNAPYGGGEFVTKPLRFSGRELVINFATSAAGSLQVELQDAAGTPLPGFTLTDALENVGDEIERVIGWNAGSDLSRFAGRPVRLRFVMKDADLYSLRFRDN
jgi:hypothetical protein